MQRAYHQYLIQGQTAAGRYALNPPPQSRLGAAGQMLGHRPGRSLEFMDHRSYHVGDDLRHIDWNAFARSDRLTVKLYRQEISPHVDLCVDVSRSMALADSAKAQATVGLSAAIATAATNGGFSHAAWTIGQTCQPVAGSHLAPSGWDGIDFDDQGDPGPTLVHQTPPWRTGGMRVLISDLLWPGDPLPVLQRMTHGSASAVVCQLLARADQQLPTRGHFRLVDSESNQVHDIWVDDVAQRRYHQRLERHQECWGQACRQMGVTLITLVAESLIDHWDLSPLVQQQLLRVTR